VPPSQQLDISSMTVDDDYQGPRLEGGFRVCGPFQPGVCVVHRCCTGRHLLCAQCHAVRLPGPAACVAAAVLTNPGS
jgi:hypothetical protein